MYFPEIVKQLFLVAIGQRYDSINHGVECRDEIGHPVIQCVVEVADDDAFQLLLLLSGGWQCLAWRRQWGGSLFGVRLWRG